MAGNYSTMSYTSEESSVVWYAYLTDIALLMWNLENHIKYDHRKSWQKIIVVFRQVTSNMMTTQCHNNTAIFCHDTNNKHLTAHQSEWRVKFLPGRSVLCLNYDLLLHCSIQYHVIVKYCYNNILCYKHQLDWDQWHGYQDGFLTVELYLR